MYVLVGQNPHLQASAFAGFNDAFGFQCGNRLAKWSSAKAKLLAKLGFREAGAGHDIASGDGSQQHMPNVARCRQAVTIPLVHRPTMFCPINRHCRCLT